MHDFSDIRVALEDYAALVASDPLCSALAEKALAVLNDNEASYKAAILSRQYHVEMARKYEPMLASMRDQLQRASDVIHVQGERIVELLEENDQLGTRLYGGYGWTARKAVSP